MNEEKQVLMPVNVLNYSSLTKLLRNPLIFKMSEILGVYSGRRGVASMIGSACHEALKVYYGGHTEIPTPIDPTEARSLAMAQGIHYIDTFPPAGIRLGKTGSMEKMLQGFSQAMQIYFAEEPTYNKILVCEEKLTGLFRDKDGNDFPLPASGIPDLVIEDKDGKIDVIDHKFVTAYTPTTDEDGEPYEDYIKIVQAMFLTYLLKAAKELTVRNVIFREIKYTVNKDGSNQIRDYVVPATHEPYHIFFKNLYCDVVSFLKNPQAIFLPNLTDRMDGQEAGLMYTQGLITGDMSDVEVMHRVKEVALTSKRFVSSVLDRAENDSLDPAERVKVKLRELGIFLFPEETKAGDNVTQYRFRAAAGTAMGKIKKHKDDIAQALMVKGEIRILAPIPGTKLVGIEVENSVRKSVQLRDEHLTPGTLMLPIGTDVQGDVTKVPLDAMPHLLIAGSTGSGKSVLVHNLLTALTKQMTPEAMHLILIDPKRVELASYAKKPHLHGTRVIYEYEDAVVKLLALVETMEERYALLEKAGKRDIGEYNASKRKAELRLPYLVIVIDEFADFMYTSKVKQTKWRKPSYTSKTKDQLYRLLVKRSAKEDERGNNVAPIQAFEKSDLIDILEKDDEENQLMREDANIELLMVRLAQMGRAAGIHLIVATQRPSVDVITGLIKSNLPCRIALTTSSVVDSRVILDEPGAEKLAGKGDMIFKHPALRGSIRLQGFMI